MTEVQTLREELDSLSSLYVACRDDYERLRSVLEEIADGPKRHGLHTVSQRLVLAAVVKKAKAAIAVPPPRRSD